MQISIFIIIIAVVVGGISTLAEQDVYSQNKTNASNLTGIENDSSSASVTARLNISTPQPEPEGYPTLAQLIND
jgi:hypothetical protein